MKKYLPFMDKSLSVSLLLVNKSTHILKTITVFYFSYMFQPGVRKENSRENNFQVFNLSISN